ncbi:2'-5' RNA ligase family protein [Chitinophaga qingshengii]|uniref:2'-5' RNA ligase family protein n=1 Tax=Chitinophaga qingshengii TaxID=1569794 RepID=A0ABR7TYC0_9BACT|nr:2'-5' RNA ligase family protein [Chitinophaga qingshengii]MBC9934511.1 2'-5' RNA ligase family protein [Chitinophaga qingshengii]
MYKLQPKPVIVTLEIASADMEQFNTLRALHFPGHANYLEAHLTLFYRLPGMEAAIPEILQQYAQRPVMPLQVSGVVNFGTGVAYTLQSSMLQELHASLQKDFDPWLVKQDRHPLRPHITIQNKVTAFKAAQLHAQLTESFTPFDITAVGFGTWAYLRGPWKALDRFMFEER